MMVSLRSWDYFSRIFAYSVILNLIGIFGTVIQWRPHEERLLHEFLTHDVTVPQILHGQHRVMSTKTQSGHLGAITLTFEAFNMSLVVDLQLNRNLFASSYIEKHFSEEGTELFINTSNHHHSHCYYHGRLRQDPDSTVAISTCHGVRGTIISLYGTYHIEPTQSVINGRHFVFNDIHQRPKNITCGHNHNIFSGFSNNYRRPTRLKRSAVKGWPYDSTSRTRVVEMYIVNDKTEYDEHDRDISQVIGRTKDIINLVSSLYRAINVYIALVGIEVWTDRDKIDVVENPDITMNNFLTYRRTHIKHPNDNAQLITGKQLGSGVVGKAPIMTICSWQYSGGVNNDHNLVVGPVATTVAHELGHNFGLSHDNEKCGCPDDRCIMAASSGGINNPTKWSRCSKRQFHDAFQQGMDYCLTNLPAAIYGPSTCGNGFLEGNEECDCGLFEDCNTACCDAYTCKLTENATCATGACCDLDTCRPKKAATLCRPADGPCDLPETCDGKHEFCPLDYHHIDGKMCSTPYGDAYCYHGKCSTHEGQCQLLWGRTGHKSHNDCYKHFNTMGQASGNCGFNWIGTQFTACRPEDIKCGMLHCTHRNEKLMFWKEALAYTMPEGFVTITQNNQHIRQDCKGAILDVGLYMPDPGMVPNGALCGDEKICVEQHCQAVAHLNVLHCPDCNDNGVCNNIGECHCDKNYAPPFCDQPGNGGSLHSGPMEINNDNVSLIVGLCIFFIIIVPLLAVAGFYGYRNRENLKKIMLHDPTERYRNERMSTIYKAKPRHDVNNSEKPGGIITRNPSVVANHIVNNTSAAAVHSSTPHYQHRINHITRSSSFRPEDISTPQLESSTKSLTGIPPLRHSVCGVPNCGPAAHAPTSRPYPTRPAPRPPHIDWRNDIVANNVESSVGAAPHRPPPPDGGFKAKTNSPRARQPLPSIPSNARDISPMESEQQPLTLGLRGGNSERYYQNTDDSDPGATSPEFSNIALDSPQDVVNAEDRFSSAANKNHCINNLDKSNHVRFDGNSTRDQGKYVGGDRDQVERSTSRVMNAKRRFDNAGHEPSHNPSSRRGVSRSESTPRTKSSAGHPSNPARTNSTAGSSRNNSSGHVTRSASNPKPPITNPKPSVGNPKPAVGEKPRIPSTKPATSKKPHTKLERGRGYDIANNQEDSTC